MKKVGGILVCMILFATISSVSLTVTAFDSIPPEWQNQGRNKTAVQPGESISLYAQGKDYISLDYAWLATNETGDWKIYSGGGWWDNSWSYRKKITIDHTKVEDQLTNFPVLIAHTSSDFADHAQPDGDDFIFVDAINTTQYNHEMEYYNSETGELLAWVNIPYLSASEDTALYVYYGNPTCDRQENINAAWDSDFIMVQHMDGDDWDDLDDSTSHGFDVTSAGGNPTYNQDGKIGKCVDFDGDDYLNAPGDLLETDSSYTAGAWVYVDGSPSSYRFVFEGDSENNGISLMIWPGDFFKSYFSAGGGAPSVQSTSVGTSNWVYVCRRADADTDELNLFINGISEDSASFTGSTINPEPQGLNIGANKDYSYGMIGKIDEIRISNVNRSNEWIRTEYNNMISPSTFLTVGIEEEEVEEGYFDEKYGSPMDMGDVIDTWVWSNFTWQNPSIPIGTVVGWRIYYVDSSGNEVATDVMSFIIMEEQPPPEPEPPDIVYVDNDYNEATFGWGVDHFDTIQDAIDVVTEGGTVTVHTGTYYEHIIIAKSVSLLGEDKNTTIIDSGGSGTVARISADKVNISGFTIQNSRVGYPPRFPPYSAIKIHSSENTIKGNIIRNNDYGLYLEGSSNNIIVDNTIINNAYTGISLVETAFCCPQVSSDNNHIYHNTFINNDQNAYDSGDNIWYNETFRQGNYWDDFDEPSEGAYDNNSDGIVDDPYNIPSGSNQDQCPLVNPRYQPESSEEPSTPEDILLEEGFEDPWVPDSNGDLAPPGWEVDIYNLAYYWHPVTEVGPTGDPVYEGTYAAQVDRDSSDKDEWLTSPDIELPEFMYSNVSLKFWAHSTTLQTDATVRVVIKGDGFQDVIWNMIEDEVWIPPPLEWKEKILDLTSYIGGTITISWQYDGGMCYNFALDNVVVSTTSPSVPALIINTPSSVVEGNYFDITISADGSSIEHAQVEFNDQMYYTNGAGIVTLSAPQVEKDTNYPITASKEGYQSDTTSITVLDQEDDEHQGWICGTVYNISGDVVEAAKICIIISDKYTISECMWLTDNRGRYIILVPGGTYTVEASKQGYKSSTKNVTIPESEAILLDFVLDKIENYTGYAPDEIQQAIQAGLIGAEITLGLDEDDKVSYKRTIYSDVSIEPLGVNIGEKEIRLQVGGETDGGQIFLITIDEKVLSFEDEFVVEFDGEAILSTDNFQDILDALSVGSDNPIYYVEEGGQLVIYATLSEHTITIYQIIETIGMVTAIILYIVCCAIVISLFSGIRVINIVRLRRYIRKRK